MRTNLIPAVSTRAALVVTVAWSVACMGGNEQPEVCQAYLDCVGESTPELLPSLTPTYGEEGSCWKGNQDERDACESTCISALTTCEPAEQPDDTDDGESE
jgi:hypothetical protein